MDFDTEFGGAMQRRFQRSPRAEIPSGVDAGSLAISEELKRSTERKQKLMQQMTNMQSGGDGESYDPSGMMEG